MNFVQVFTSSTLDLLNPRFGGGLKGLNIFNNLLVRSLHPRAALFITVTRQMGGRLRRRLRLTEG